MGRIRLRHLGSPARWGALAVTVALAAGSGGAVAVARGHRHRVASPASMRPDPESTTTAAVPPIGSSPTTTAEATTSAPVAGTPPVPAPPTTTTTTTTVSAALRATPDRGLPERGYVTLDAAGLPPMSRLYVEQCATGTSTCDSQWWASEQTVVSTNSAGALVGTTYAVRRVLSGGIDCAAAPGCVLRVSDSRVVFAETSLSFTGPAGPPIPMTLTVTPSSNLVDGATVHVHGSSFMPGAGQVLEQCGGGMCELAPDVEVAPDGTFTTSVVVHAVLTLDGNSFDCGQGGCVIETGQDDSPPVPISFGS